MSGQHTSALLERRLLLHDERHALRHLLRRGTLALQLFHLPRQHADALLERSLFLCQLGLCSTTLALQFLHLACQDAGTLLERRLLLHDERHALRHLLRRGTLALQLFHLPRQLRHVIFKLRINILRAVVCILQILHTTRQLRHLALNFNFLLVSLLQ